MPGPVSGSSRVISERTKSRSDTPPAKVVWFQTRERFWSSETTRAHGSMAESTSADLPVNRPSPDAMRHRLTSARGENLFKVSATKATVAVSFSMVFGIARRGPRPEFGPRKRLQHIMSVRRPKTHVVGRLGHPRAVVISIFLFSRWASLDVSEGSHAGSHGGGRPRGTPPTEGEPTTTASSQAASPK